MDGSGRASACADSQRRLDPAGERPSRRRTVLVSLLAASFVLPTAGRAADDAALAQSKKCLNCHALDRKVVGPAFKAVAARYADDRDAQDRLATKIRAGGAGAWGVVPMPANDVTAAEAAALAHWVLQQK